MPCLSVSFYRKVSTLKFPPYPFVLRSDVFYRKTVDRKYAELGPDLLIRFHSLFEHLSVCLSVACLFICLPVCPCALSGHRSHLQMKIFSFHVSVYSNALFVLVIMMKLRNLVLSDLFRHQIRVYC